MVHAYNSRTRDTEAAGSQKQNENNKATLASSENMEYVLFDKKKKEVELQDLGNYSRSSNNQSFVSPGATRKWSAVPPLATWSVSPDL